ncbi:P-loop containing nucleoside triphosphate hydrolase protein [Amylostereum chailletii]|nr:P-loop containing nucleoside triphosphate hydrolase protein [Amylostereum chailletii]
MPPNPIPSNDESRGSQLSTSTYAETRKELLRLVQNLRAIGAQAVVDVPRVVVIGNQSAGKSSVVEAISGINVPRDSGTCTRCPMECRLVSFSGDWGCQISIRWEYDSNDKKNSKVVEVPFGDLISLKSEVELSLRRAQFAVLNPDVDSKTILSLTTDQLRKGVKGSKPLQFSRNVVCVDIQGPDLTDLSFIDLPGLIQVAEEPHLVRLVESLVVDHITGNSLILVAVPMTDDLENQKALTLAREADPDGKRTIGVLTKPDVISKGSRSRDLWLEVIEGRNAKKRLLHGYFCTRQPDDDERDRGITFADARQAEARFFESTEPWSKSTNKNRFGIRKLVETLSPLLERIIKDTLPKVSKEATEHLQNCELELSQLPPALDRESVSYMFDLVSTLSHDVSNRVKGAHGFEWLIQHNRAAYKMFKDDIHDTTPVFVAQERRSVHTFRTGDIEDSDVEGNDTGSDAADTDEDRERDAGRARGSLLRPAVSITQELPNNTPYPAKVTLIVKFQSQWSVAVDKCIHKTCENTREVLLACVATRFSQWDFLCSYMRGCINELIDQHFANCKTFLEAILEAENAPWTQNTHYLAACRDKWLSHYRDERAERSTAGHILAALAQVGYPGLVAADLGRLNKPDEYETEMEVMAEVRAYFQVAYKRIIDIVPALIDLKFVKEYVVFSLDSELISSR